MNFSKLKLTENAAGVAITSNNPATKNATASGNMANAGANMQSQGTVNARAAQTKQSVGQSTGGQATNTSIRKKSPTMGDTQMNATTPVQTNIQSSYDQTLARVELVKLRESSKCDWRHELMEAANPNDDPEHPFVEVMPYNDFRMKEAKKMMAQAAAKDKAEGQLTQAPGGMTEAAMDYTTQKKKSGKAISKGCGDTPVKNSDNTATPKENEKRRMVNAIPQLRGFMGKKAVKGMETDAFSDK